MNRRGVVDNRTEQTELKFDPLVGDSDATERLKWMIRKVAPLDATVLILGETGTGKEIVARMIHENSSHHLEHFVPVHAAGIPESLLESALFGHEKGAFTGAYKNQKGFFEMADNGTLFLDEIGEVSMTMQVKLLRVLQDGLYYRIGESEPRASHARIIAATNKNLKKLVEQGKFREDLYYRLNVITLEIPPLRERKEDISLLTRHFLRKFMQKHNRLGLYLKPETINLLTRYSWPGNVRELENVIERIVALSDSDWIGIDELPAELVLPAPSWTQESDQFLPYAGAKTLFEREYIVDLLRRSNGNISQAARIAQIPRQNLHIKIKKYDIKSRIEESDDDRDDYQKWN
ncbi:MAG: sigma-54-dependent Fis family transcriptional regulator [Calditrichaeota bacterium]|nr:MAG: sigma-54-dependent Fis family transcriptional regulator [Calditrichota bacterium]